MTSLERLDEKLSFMQADVIEIKHDVKKMTCNCAKHRADFDKRIETQKVKLSTIWRAIAIIAAVLISLTTVAIAIIK